MDTMDRRSLLKGVLSALVVGSPVLLAHRAEAKQAVYVQWSEVAFPEDKQAKRRERALRKLLGIEAGREKWGKHPGGRLRASIRVTEFEVTRKESVVRVTCSAVGSLENGPSVRTHFSLGDRPDRQQKLEEMVLTLVARGVVTRLASIDRRRTLPQKGKSK